MTRKRAPTPSAKPGAFDPEALRMREAMLRRQARALLDAELVAPSADDLSGRIARETVGPVTVAISVHTARRIGEALLAIADGGDGRAVLGVTRKPSRPPGRNNVAAVTYLRHRAAGMDRAEAHRALCAEMERAPGLNALSRWLSRRSHEQREALFAFVELSGTDTAELRARIARDGHRGRW